mgnify:CR=1 FL=1
MHVIVVVLCMNNLMCNLHHWKEDRAPQCGKTSAGARSRSAAPLRHHKAGSPGRQDAARYCRRLDDRMTAGPHHMLSRCRASRRRASTPSPSGSTAAGKGCAGRRAAATRR